jgi:hypothetical protein
LPLSAAERKSNVSAFVAPIKVAFPKTPASGFNSARR